MKSPLKSKTLWVNFLVAGAAFFPGMVNIMSPDKLIMLLSVVNVILRVVTKEKLGLEE